MSHTINIKYSYALHTLRGRGTVWSSRRQARCPKKREAIFGLELFAVLEEGHRFYSSQPNRCKPIKQQLNFISLSGRPNKSQIGMLSTTYVLCMGTQ